MCVFATYRRGLAVLTIILLRPGPPCTCGPGPTSSHAAGRVRQENRGGAYGLTAKYVVTVGYQGFFDVRRRPRTNGTASLAGGPGGRGCLTSSQSKPGRRSRRY